MHMRTQNSNPSDVNLEGMCLCRWASEHMKKKLTGTGGPALVSAYNVMTQVLYPRPQPNAHESSALLLSNCCAQDPDSRPCSSVCSNLSRFMPCPKKAEEQSCV